MRVPPNRVLEQPIKFLVSINSLECVAFYIESCNITVSVLLKYIRTIFICSLQ